MQVGVNTIALKGEKNSGFCLDEKSYFGKYNPLPCCKVTAALKEVISENCT